MTEPPATEPPTSEPLTSEPLTSEPPTTEPPTSGSLGAEDRKLVTLARSVRARTQAAEGAAVRDTDGRTYAAATVDLASLQVSALGVCVAMALSSGSAGLEAAVLLTEAVEVRAEDLAVVRDYAGSGVVVHRGDLRGNPAETLVT